MLVGAIVALVKPKDIQRILDDHLEMAEKRSNKTNLHTENKQYKGKRRHHRKNKNKQQYNFNKDPSRSDGSGITDLDNKNIKLQRASERKPK